MAPRAPRLPRRPGRDRRPEPIPGPVEGSEIRSARSGDIAAIIALQALMFEAMGATAEEVSDATWQGEASRWIQLRLADEHTHIVVAEANGTVVSCAVGQVIDLMPSPTRLGEGGIITNVATFPRHRRLGFTQATFATLVDWFTEETEVEMLAVTAVDDVRPVYERFGFVESTFPEMRLRLERPEAAPED